MKATITPRRLSGTVKAPGSKSYSQRYILMAGMGDTPLYIHGIYFSEDEQVALGIVRSAGSTLTFDGDTVKVEPTFTCPRYVDAGESATSYRLSLGMLASRHCKTEFIGKPGLARRPMGELIQALKKLGADIEIKEDGFIRMDASKIRTEKISIDQSESSQFVSAMLFFLAFGDKRGGNLMVTGKRSSEGYVKITVSCMRSLGYNVTEENGNYSIEKARTHEISDIFVERDYSSAAFFLILGMLSSEDGISIEGLPDNSLQSDATIMDVLKESSEGITMTFSDNKIIANALKGYVKHVEIDANVTPDLAPPVSVLGIFSSDGVTIRNPLRLGIKESDRYHEIIRLAESFGARVEEGEGYLDIKKGHEILNPEKLSFDDHRMIMSAIVAGLASGYEIEYDNVEKINKSYPSFLTDLKKIGASVRMEPVL